MKAGNREVVREGNTEMLAVKVVQGHQVLSAEDMEPRNLYFDLFFEVGRNYY